MHFRKVADLAGPVVHFHIDVQVVVTIPRGLDGVGPQSLQVGWQQVLACGTDEQITPVMKITGRQPWVIIDKEVFPMIFQGQLLFLFWGANHQIHAIK